MIFCQRQTKLSYNGLIDAKGQTLASRKKITLYNWEMELKELVSPQE